jgi:hypothetical protein
MYFLRDDYLKYEDLYLVVKETKREISKKGKSIGGEFFLYSVVEKIKSNGGNIFV